MADLGAIGKTRVLAIKSSDRLYGTPSNFAISLSQFNLDPTYVSYNQVALPNGFYNITSGSNSITVAISIVGAGVFGYTTVTVPPGNYNSATLFNGTSGSVYPAWPGLLSSLNTAITTLDPVISSAFFDTNLSGISPTTGYVTLQVAAAWLPPAKTFPYSFSIYTAAANSTPPQPVGLEQVLGFEGPSFGYNIFAPAVGTTAPPYVSNVNGTFFTGTSCLDLRTAPSIYIRSSLVAGNYITGSGPESVLAIVQNFAIYGQTIFHRNTNPDVDVYPVAGRVGLVNFQLVNEYGVELNMDSGQEWELSLCFYTP